MMLCPLCHTLNRDNAKFCKGCGQTLAVEIVAGEQANQSAETLQSTMPSSMHQPSDAHGSAQAAGVGHQPVLDPNDPSFAPTEILTPPQMAEFQAQRRQREFEQSEKEVWDQTRSSEQAN